MSKFLDEVNRRRTSAIISHPDAGKTTLTEKMLLLGNIIQIAGTVKGKKSGRHITSDWMELEKKRGISVTTSVMQFPYKNCIINLLDTPGHEDFSEDTYRTLTAVDSAFMVIDGVKGVESRTINLMGVCRLKLTPILTFINKFDRDTRDPIELMDEIERLLDIQCAPITWPISSGKEFKGIYHIYRDEILLFETGHGHHNYNYKIISGINNPNLECKIGYLAKELRDQIDLIKGASHAFNIEKYHCGKLTPVFFGTALGNFGIKEMLDTFAKYAPSPTSRNTNIREVYATEAPLTGFVFKIQANMDLQHRDRIAFFRICSGKYTKGVKLQHVRLNKKVQISNALTFIAGQRESLQEGYPGDIIGLHNHGTIQIGDTFTEGEVFKFTGIPNFAPEIFKRIHLNNPLKMKSLLKGLIQLSEEGATQVFRPLSNNELILGAIGVLQFDVVVHRLEYEYDVKCSYESINVMVSRWIESDNKKILETFRSKYVANLAIDGANCLTYLAPSHINLKMVEERNPKIKFQATREH